VDEALVAPLSRPLTRAVSRSPWPCVQPSPLNIWVPRAPSFFNKAKASTPHRRCRVSHLDVVRPNLLAKDFAEPGTVPDAFWSPSFSSRSCWRRLTVSSRALPASGWYGKAFDDRPSAMKRPFHNPIRLMPAETSPAVKTDGKPQHNASRMTPLE